MGTGIADFPAVFFKLGHGATNENLSTDKLSRGVKNLGSRVALLPGIFLVRPEIFEGKPEKPDKLSGFFQIISHFPDGFKTSRIFPDHIPFSGRFQNLPDFSRSFPKQF